tara:strand:- start:989 stop:1258 length:270 start_codon:yes stop_codon:yes gene_type:complete
MDLHPKPTTPESVDEANKALFHATMNIPTAAKHCGMTEKQMKYTFREFLKYHEANYQITENPITLPRREESGDPKTIAIPPRPFPGKRV